MKEGVDERSEVEPVEPRELTMRPAERAPNPSHPNRHAQKESVWCVSMNPTDPGHFAPQGARGSYMRFLAAAQGKLASRGGAQGI